MPAAFCTIVAAVFARVALGELDQVRLTVDPRALQNVLCGGAERARIESSLTEWDRVDGSLLLNGHGSKYTTTPKKNYRFTDRDGRSIVLMNSVREPCMMTSRLIANLSAALGAHAATVTHVEVWVNAHYQGLYQSKEIDPSANAYKVQSEERPSNASFIYRYEGARLVERLDWNGYYGFSQVSTFMAVSDMRAHNYAWVRLASGDVSILIWDADQVLGNGGNSLFLHEDKADSPSWQTVMLNMVMMRREQPVDYVLPHTTWHAVYSPYDIHDPVLAPLNESRYLAQYRWRMAEGALSDEAMERQVRDIAREIEPAIRRDARRWDAWWCEGFHPGRRMGDAVDQLLDALSLRRSAMQDALDGAPAALVQSPFRYCNLVRSLDPFVTTLIGVAVTASAAARAWGELACAVVLGLNYVAYNRFDILDVSGVLETPYVLRNDVVLLCLILVQTICFSVPRAVPRARAFKLAVYCATSCIANALAVVEMVELSRLSDAHQTVSSTGKILVDYDIFDDQDAGVRVLLVWIWWKAVYQLASLRYTLHVPALCQYLRPTGPPTAEDSKKRRIVRFIYGNIGAFVLMLGVLFAVRPLDLTAVQACVQVSSALISLLVVFNLRGVYVVLKYGMLRRISMRQSDINLAFSNRTHEWDLDALVGRLCDERRLEKDAAGGLEAGSVVRTPVGASKGPAHGVDRLGDDTRRAEAVEVAERAIRTADAVPKKLSHIVDGLIVYVLSVQQAGADSGGTTFNKVYTYSAIVLMMQLFLYLASYGDAGAVGVVMYASKARVMDGSLGRENEIFGWICDKYMLPVVALLETALSRYIDLDDARLISAFTFLPIIIGDSFGEVVGSAFGKQTIKVWGMGERNTKSVEGTAAVFVSSLVSLVGAALYEGAALEWYALAVVVSAVSTAIELYAPRSTDNVMMLTGNLACCLLFGIATKA